MSNQESRRAQPESETTQAAPLSEVQIDRIARAYFSEQWAVQHAKDAIHDAFEDARKSATLSPLCGAQHAESGLNLDRLDALSPAASIARHEEIERAVDARYPLQNSPHASVNDKIGAARLAFRNGYRAALAAQQAAAPGAKLMTYDEFFAEARRLGCKLPADVCAALAAAPDYSAPGTPEAPADLPRLYRFDCYVGKTKMAAGVGVHASTMEEAEQKARTLIDKEETIKFESNQPCHPTRKCSICAAYERAAQLNGGQEGSGSNADQA